MSERPALTPEPYYNRPESSNPPPSKATASPPPLDEETEMIAKPDVALALRQQAITKEDGRYLIYYTFKIDESDTDERSGENV